jgi:glyoxylase-like metal-dependent hydrolase (beta-lactamase superfamily II)
MALIASLAGSAAAPQAEPVYEVYAVRFGTVTGFPARAIVAGADTGRKMDLAMMVWVVKGAGRTVLVDAGFTDQRFITQWKPEGYQTPVAALAPLGIKAEDVTDVIITHVHWDHLDGLGQFPKARVWIQQDEYEYYVNDSGRVLHRAIDSADAVMLAKAKVAQRVTLVAGDSVMVLPGIRVYTGGKHTYASEYVGVHSKSGTTILASDNCYTYENLEKKRPIAQTLDSVSNLAAQARMLRLASSPRLVVPGHDPQVFVRFPRPGHGIARID